MIAQTQGRPPTDRRKDERRHQPLTGRLREVALRYQKILRQNPRHAEALAGMSLIALASRQKEAALNLAKAAVAAAPRMAAAWIVFGQTLRATHHAKEARQAYEAALRLDAKSSLARVGLGELKIAEGEPEAALADFEAALARDPNLMAARMGLGHALACLDRFAAALAHYETIIARYPLLPEAEFAAGFALVRLGRVEEAERRYRRAISLRPDFAAAWMNLGCLMREQGKDLYAEAALCRAAELRPDLVPAWLNLALLMRELGRIEEAEAHLNRAYALDRERVETHVAWTQFYVARKDLKTAQEWLEKALQREPENPEAMNMRGILLHHEERFAEAVRVFERAEALGSKQAVSNRGNSLLEVGRVREALVAHRRAVDLDARHAGSRYNLALTQIRCGEWLEGWKNYEARWGFREVHRQPRIYNRPRWHGEQLQGKRILLHAEQGLGDAIQFCRYADLVSARGGFPILQVHRPVARLLQSLAIVRAGKAEIALLGEAPSAFDWECPLMSLPAVFETTVDTVPWDEPYLAAEVPDDEARASALFPDGDCGYPRVGIAWAGNPRYKADAKRSTTLTTLLPLLESSGIDWISLQKGEAAKQLALLPPEVRMADGASGDRDLADAAALIARLDLVITTDTSIAHLAGAMGKPVWIMLPHLSDWRWMQEIETTPWYRSARLFRQSSSSDWAGVMERVRAGLQALCGGW